MQYSRFFLIVLLLSCCGFSAAQDMFTYKYTYRQGLPIDVVDCAAQDNDGFMWFGTNFGIVRYDGQDFKNYSYKEGLLTKTVTDIVFAGGDSLVFISYPEALQSIHLDGHVVTLAPHLDSLGFKPQLIEPFGKGFFIYQRDTNKFIFVDKSGIRVLMADSVTGRKDVMINKITATGNAAEYILCTEKGAFLISSAGATAITNEAVTNGIITHDKNLLLAGAKHIFRADKKGKNIQVLPVMLPPSFRVLSMLEEKDGQFLLSGFDGNVLMLIKDHLTDISKNLSLEKLKVNRFFRDRDDNIWFCTKAGILLKKKEMFDPVNAGETLPNNSIETLLQVNNGILIGTGNGLSFVNQTGMMQRILIPGKAAVQQNVYRLLGMNETGASVSISNANTHSRPYIIQPSAAGTLMIAQTFFSALVNDSIWIFDEGRGVMQIFPKNDIKPAREINLTFSECKKVYACVMYEGKYWLGTDKGIIQIDKSRMIHIHSLQNKTLHQVFKLMHRKKDNSLWLATDIGLYYYKGKNFFPFPQAELSSANYCHDIVEDRKGDMWVATFYGLFSTNGNSITKKLSTRDGLPSQIINCLAIDSAGNKLYVGANNGLCTLNIDNADQAFIKIPSVKCFLRDSAKPIRDKSILSPANYNLVFEVSIPEYGNPDEINIEYKIDNGDWIRSKNFKVNIDGIGPGEHHFYVHGYLAGSSSRGPDSVFIFTIKTPFYKTWWFRLLMFILAQGLIIYLILVINKNRRRKALRRHQQFLELATLRQKAFTTLINPHFIFNALNSIQNYINKQDRQAANRYLSDFASLIRRNFDAAQQAFVPLEQEIENMRLYLQLEKMRFPGKFEYELTVPDDVDTEEQMIPTMIIQPFLENAILHGLSWRKDAGMLRISMQRKNDALEILITDNGIGIEKSRAVQSGSRHKSRGMQLIREKLSVLSRFGNRKITLEVKEAFPGEEYPGTQIHIIIPDSIYQNFPGEAVVHW